MKTKENKRFEVFSVTSVLYFCGLSQTNEINVEVLHLFSVSVIVYVVFKTWAFQLRIHTVKITGLVINDH